MNTTEPAAREIALPAITLGIVRAQLRAAASAGPGRDSAEAGELAAIHALHDAGYGAGTAVFEGLERTFAEAVETLGSRFFFEALSQHFGRRGWGTLHHSSPHAAIGLLTSTDWAEATSGASSQPTCSFSAGMLSQILSRSAGAPVAVLEVECRSCGDGRCSFAFGSGDNIHVLYGHLLDGRSLEEGLARL